MNKWIHIYTHAIKLNGKMPNIGKYIGIWGGEFVATWQQQRFLKANGKRMEIAKIGNWHMNCTQGFNPKEMVWCEMV